MSTVRRPPPLVLAAAAALGTLVPAPGARLPAQVPPVALHRVCERPPCVGPRQGALLLAGGGTLGDDVWRSFVRLAGGDGARIVVIPTAREREDDPRNLRDVHSLHAAGATRVTILHARDPDEADGEAFVAPLLEATGVWITGGHGWRLAATYLHTRTQDALEGVLARDGVVGGTSAGASMMASYLVRGTPEGNHVVRAPGWEEGFGLLRGVAVDQHLIARGRERDLLDVLRLYPQLLGIGLDEGTALVVRGDRAEFIGRSRVAVYERGGWVHPVPFEWLDPGEVYDLGTGDRLPLDRDGAGGGG